MLRVGIALVGFVLAWFWLRAGFSRAIAAQSSGDWRPRDHGRVIAMRGGVMVAALVGLVAAVWADVGWWAALAMIAALAAGSAAVLRKAYAVGRRIKRSRGDGSAER